MKYLLMMHDGNPFAFWFIAGCCAFCAFVFWITPLSDKDIDEEMRRYEEEAFLRDLAVQDELRKAA